MRKYYVTSIFAGIQKQLLIFEARPRRLPALLRLHRLVRVLARAQQLRFPRPELRHRRGLVPDLEDSASSAAGIVASGAEVCTPRDGERGGAVRGAGLRRG